MSQNNEKKWTDQQKQAIGARNKTILVSAAAGSGKTATLTERIIQRITIDNADISNMLIVTFTRSAAADLKLKIFNAITSKLATVADNAIASKLSTQLANINNATICTIDSFYYELVKSNFTECGVSPTFRIIDSGEYKLIAKNTINEVIDEFYENDESFSRFADCFASVKDISSLGDKILSIYTMLSSLTEGIEYLKNYSEEALANQSLDIMQTNFGVLLRAESEKLFSHYFKVFEDSLEKIMLDEGLQRKFHDSIMANYLICVKILNELKRDDVTYEEIQAIIKGFAPVDLIKNRIQKTDFSENLKVLRKEFHNAIDDHVKLYYRSSPETVKRALIESAKYVGTLYALLKRFDEKMTEQKKRLDFLTFNDISRKTYSLLVKDNQPTDIAKKIAEEYGEIYIDEYQDVDPLQNQIFAAISKPTNRFMVGDIKQSIYQFRGAEPTLFSDLRKSFPDISESENSSTATIFMSNNFRCDKCIIDFTNLVCSFIFRQIGGCVDYKDGDNLVFSKKCDTPLKEKVKVSVISLGEKKASASKSSDVSAEASDVDSNTSDNGVVDNNVDAASNLNVDNSGIDEDFGALAWESEHIANQIKDLIDNGKNADGSPIRPGDIAVLFRKSKISIYLSDALRRRNIKVAETESSQYFENDDVLLMLCVLNAIDNPERDVYLAGTLRSPLFDFSVDELLKLRSAYNDPSSLFYALCTYAKKNDDALAKKCNDFYETLTLWQENAQSLSIDRFLLMLFNTDRFIASGILSNQGNDGEGGNVLLLYDYARCFQGNGFKGLYEFIEYLNSLIEQGQSLPAASKSDAPDRVTLMTIHKSKGLEYPVCFLSFCGNNFNNEDAKQNLVLSYPHGIAMKLIDDSGFSHITTPMHSLIASKMYQNCVEEEIRVLYVALTRARERLFISGVSRSRVSTIKGRIARLAEFSDKYTVTTECKNYLDWILLALNEQEYDFSTLEYITPENIKIVLSNEASVVSDEAHCDIDDALYERLADSFSFEYPYAALSRVPSKLSVSRLYPDMLDENDTSYDLFVNERPVQIPDFFSEESGKSSAAERGTATHLFLQFCNFEYAATHGINEEIERLCALKYIPSNIKELIYIDELEKFIESDLLIEILKAKRIIREQRFNVSLPPQSFTSDVSLIQKLQGESLAVQGVIDLIVITQNDEIKLYDYKTDRLTAKELESYDLAKAKLEEKHAQQLSYYAKACEKLFGKACDSVQIYSTHAAKLYEIDI